MSALDWVRGRVDPTAATAVFLAGDLLAIAVFVVMGEVSHGYGLAAAARIAGTYAQFLLGWLAVATLTGVYAGDFRRSLGRSVGLVVASWLGAVVVAQALRSTAAFPGNAAVSFAAVAFLVGGVLLVTWRLTVALVTSRLRSTAPA